MSSLNKKEELESSSCRSIVVAIEEELANLPKLSPVRKRCIYRVPKQLRQLKEEAYTPALVSIGPFHHKNERLLPMETPKLRHLESFIQHRETHGDLNTYIAKIKDNEREIRDSYAEDIDMPSHEFVRMILIDSIFIIRIFRFERRIDIMPSINYEEVHGDLKLAENQLPFFILEELFSVAFGLESGSFMDTACEFLEVDKNRVKVDPVHLLDLLRSHYSPSQKRTTNTTTKKHNKCDLCPTATSLRAAGVKFCVSDKDKPCSLLDIHFDEKKGILTLPSLIVDDHTESIFRNMIAFEQCHYYPHQTTYIAHYQCFMDCLINTREDVNLLVEREIIENFLGSDKEVSCLINSLGTLVYTDSDDYSYAGTTAQLNYHYNKPWNRYRATLKHTYFKHPWAVLSVIYAVILLLLTIAQLLTGILAVPGVKN